jgi:hypothetical protein
MEDTIHVSNDTKTWSSAPVALVTPHWDQTAAPEGLAGHAFQIGDGPAAFIRSAAQVPPSRLESPESIYGHGPRYRVVFYLRAGGVLGDGHGLFHGISRDRAATPVLDMIEVSSNEIALDRV